MFILFVIFLNVTVMAFVTYILLAGVMLGKQKRLVLSTGLGKSISIFIV